MSSEHAGSLDPRTIEELRAQLGDEIFERVLAEYLEEIPRYVTAMRTGMQRGDSEAVLRGAHSLRGASLLVGGVPLGAACEHVEKAATGASPAGLEAAVEAVERIAATTEAAVRERLAR